MTYEQITNDLKNKIYSPIYILMGEEPYYIDLISNYIANNVLSDSERDFNQTILYGKDVDAATVITASRRFPMMANHQVIILKEAQNLKNIEELQLYADKPLKSTILVICYKYGTLPKNRKFYKSASKVGVVFESSKLYDNQVPAWINNYLKERKVLIEPTNSQLLTDYLGSDLSKIVNELDKLLITLPAGTNKITAEQIETNIGISKEYNVFELQKALSQKNVLKVNRIINYFGENQKEHHITMVISNIFGYFLKILMFHYLTEKNDDRSVASTLGVNPFFVKDYRAAAQKFNARKAVEIISILRDFDMKSKGYGNSSADAKDLMKEMFYKILH